MIELDQKFVVVLDYIACWRPSWDTLNSVLKGGSHDVEWGSEDTGLYVLVFVPSYSEP